MDDKLISPFSSLWGLSYFDGRHRYSYHEVVGMKYGMGLDSQSRDL